MIKLNRNRFDPEIADFTLRRNTWRALKTMYRTSKAGVRYLYAKLQDLMVEPDLNPYQQWEMSTSKVEIRCDLDIEEVVSLGSFKMDLEASCEIMREYICRRFGNKLNDLKIGSTFRFIVKPKDGDMIMLKIEDEPFVFSKEYTLFKIDKETMLGTMTISILPDPDAGFAVGEFVRVKDYPEEDDELVAKLMGKVAVPGEENELLPPPEK